MSFTQDSAQVRPKQLVYPLFSDIRPMSLAFTYTLTSCQWIPRDSLYWTLNISFLRHKSLIAPYICLLETQQLLHQMFPHCSHWRVQNMRATALGTETSSSLVTQWKLPEHAVCVRMWRSEQPSACSCSTSDIHKVIIIIINITVIAIIIIIINGCYWVHITLAVFKVCTRVGWSASHGPGDVGRVLFGLHAQHRYAGGPPLELGLGLEGGGVAVGRRGQERVGEEVVDGDVVDTELVLLVVGEAHVAMVTAAGGVGVRRWDAGRGPPREHTGGHHRASRWRGCPQVVGDLNKTERCKVIGQSSGRRVWIGYIKERF